MIYIYPHSPEGGDGHLLEGAIRSVVIDMKNVLGFFAERHWHGSCGL